jgi:hypothetical protein
MEPIAQILTKYGPSRSARVAGLLREEHGVSDEAARKRLERAKQPVRSFPVPLLPKREAFLYLQDERGSERFWTNFLDALRETDSVYGAAIDGLIARGGVVTADEFAVISGAPTKQKKHVATDVVAKKLVDAGFVERLTDASHGEIIRLFPYALGPSDTAGMKVRNAVEGVMLDGLREWAKKNGCAGYNSIAIRGDEHPRLVGPYKWDLTGPSYLLPLRGTKDAESQGFLTADVFAVGPITHHQIKYMIRKAVNLRATTNVGRVLPMIVAPSFTGQALTEGHRAGLWLTTPSNLFGGSVGRALGDLVATLTKAAEMVSGNPDKLAGLIENLGEIEGAAGNLRGILFELMVAYIIRQEGNIDMGRVAYDKQAGKMADIDILLVKSSSDCVAYECKGKGPGNNVTLDEVDDWLRRLPIFRAHIRAQQNLAEADIAFELWSSGGFDADALAKLEKEKPLRTKNPISWVDGRGVRERAKSMKESRVTRAFDEHFFRHPLAEVGVDPKSEKAHLPMVASAD